MNAHIGIYIKIYVRNFVDTSLGLRKIKSFLYLKSGVNKKCGHISVLHNKGDLPMVKAIGQQDEKLVNRLYIKISIIYIGNKCHPQDGGSDLALSCRSNIGKGFGKQTENQRGKEYRKGSEISALKNLITIFVGSQKIRGENKM